MTWLSEIEADSRKRRLGPHRQLPESWAERMARVIRWQNKTIWLVNKYLVKNNDISLECYLSENFCADSWALLDELDRQEITDELTAKS